MNAKTLLFSFFSLFLFSAAHAQDKIYKKNGEVIDAKVSVINGDIVVFKRYSNPDGPEYSIPKADVYRIKYTNGTEDVFEENNDHIGVTRREGQSEALGIAMNQNIVAFAPIQITENGFGFSLSWERFLDKSGWVSFFVPAVLTFNMSEDSYQGTSRMDPIFYVMPGIKVYTNMNSSRKTKFSIGPSLVLGAGQSRTYNYYNTSYTTGDPGARQSRLLLGAMANIGGNLFPTNHLYMGFDFGLGFTYLNQYDGAAKGVSTLTQMSFRIGYRYASAKKK